MTSDSDIESCWLSNSVYIEELGDRSEIHTIAGRVSPLTVIGKGNI